MELDRNEEALADARRAVERCATASADIKKILQRLLEDLVLRCASGSGTTSSDGGVDTTDL